MKTFQKPTTPKKAQTKQPDKLHPNQKKKIKVNKDTINSKQKIFPTSKL